MEYTKGNIVLALFACTVMAVAVDGRNLRQKCIDERTTDFLRNGHQSNWAHKVNCMDFSDKVKSTTVTTEATVDMRSPFKKCIDEGTADFLKNGHQKEWTFKGCATVVPQNRADGLKLDLSQPK